MFDTPEYSSSGYCGDSKKRIKTSGIIYDGGATGCFDSCSLNEVLKELCIIINNCCDKSHVHYIADEDGTNQFSFGIDEAVRIEGTGGTSISFDPDLKKIIINSDIGFELFTEDTVTLHLFGSGTEADPLYGDVQVSQQSNNAIEILSDGLYVPNLIKNGVVYGGIVTWIAGYTYHISPAGYYINYQFYESPEIIVTLDPPDTTYDRFDSFIVDITGVASVVTGTPSNNPAEPGLDIGLQLKLSSALVQVGTIDPGIGLDCIYLENSEWTQIIGNARFNTSSISNPCQGSVNIEATNVITTDAIRYQNPGGIIDVVADYTVLTFKIKAKAGWPGPKRISIRWWNGGFSVGSAVIIGSGNYGFDRNNITTCQTVSIPISDFNLPLGGSFVNSLEISITGSGGALPGFYLDAICLQEIEVPDPPALEDIKVKVSANDTTTGYLSEKLVAGTNVTLVELNDGGNETYEINVPDETDPVALAAQITLIAGDAITIPEAATQTLGSPPSWTINHADTSSVANLDTTGAEVIDTLTFDTFGHVQTVTTRTLTLSDLGYVAPDISGQNAIHEISTNVFEWGFNPLLHDTVITHDGFKVTYTGVRNGNLVEVLNTDTNPSAVALFAQSPVIAVYGSSTTGLGVLGVTSNNIGVSGSASTSGTGIQGTSVNGTAGSFTINPQVATGATNTFRKIIELNRVTQGTPGNGIGGFIAYNTITSTLSNTEAGRIGFITTDITNGSVDTRFEVWTELNNSLSRKFAVEGNGQLFGDTYGIGTHTGTLAKVIGTTAAGAFIEIDPATLAGSDLNFAEDDLTFNGNRVHALANYQWQISGTYATITQNGLSGQIALSATRVTGEQMNYTVGTVGTPIIQTYTKSATSGGIYFENLIQQSAAYGSGMNFYAKANVSGSETAHAFFLSSGGITFGNTNLTSTSFTIEELPLTTTGYVIFYDPTTGVLTYGAAPAGGGGGLANAYSQMTDGTTTATASGGDTFKFRSANSLLTAVVTNNDGTHGDNLLLTVSAAEIRNLFSAGTGISYNSTTGEITNSAPDQTVVLTAGGAIDITGTYPNFTISHEDTSTYAGLDTTGAEVIDTVTVDTYGHVTGITVRTLTLADLGYTAPSDISIYTDDASLTANRTATLAGFDLQFIQGANEVFSILPTERVVVGATASSTIGRMLVDGIAGDQWRGFDVGLHLREPSNGMYWLLFTNEAADVTHAGEDIGTIHYLGDDGDYWIESKRRVGGVTHHTTEIGLDPAQKLITISATNQSNGTIYLKATDSGTNNGHILFGNAYLDTRNDGTSTTNRFLAVDATGYMKSYAINSTDWDSAYSNMIVSAAFTGTTTKTLTLTQQDGGTITASFTDDSGGAGVGSLQEVTDVGNTTNNDIVLIVDDPATNTSAPSPSLIWTTKRDDAGFDDTVSWQAFADTYNSSGSSYFYIQNKINAGAYQTYLKLDSTGSVSFYDASATGNYSFAHGFGSTANLGSAVIGSQNADALGDRSFIASGQNFVIQAGATGAAALATDGIIHSTGTYSVVFNDANDNWSTASLTMGFGNDNYAENGLLGGSDNVLGHTSTDGLGTGNNYFLGFMYGLQNRATGNNTYTLGKYLYPQGNNIMAFGSGVGTANRMALTEVDSFNVGFNSTVPSFIVHAPAVGGVGAVGMVETAYTLKVGSLSQDDTETKIVVWNSTDKILEWRDATTLGGGGSYTDEQAQDAVGLNIISTDTVTATYTDATPEYKWDVIVGAVDNLQTNFVMWDGTAFVQREYSSLPFLTSFTETDPVATAKTITLTQSSGISITGTAGQTLGSNPSWTIAANPEFVHNTVKKVEVRFKVGATGAPVLDGETSFILVDCSSTPVTNRKVIFIRERSEQWVDDDYTYNSTTGEIILTNPAIAGERFLFRIERTEVWTECSYTSTPIDSLKINSTDNLMINATDKFII